MSIMDRQSRGFISGMCDPAHRPGRLVADYRGTCNRFAEGNMC